jgi:hypothetical protein
MTTSSYSAYTFVSDWAVTYNDNDFITINYYYYHDDEDIDDDHDDDDDDVNDDHDENDKINYDDFITEYCTKCELQYQCISKYFYTAGINDMLQHDD